MVLATFTFGDALFMILELALLFLWCWIAVGVLFDVFRSHDLSNGRKALWMFFIVAIPFLGVLGYLVVRGHTMHEHQAQDAQAWHEATLHYMRGAGSGGPVERPREAR